MRGILLYSFLFIAFGYQNLYGQCDFITPPAVKKIDYASRQITFSGVTMNGIATTYLAVEKGASVTIKTVVESRKDGSYCPDCIVQIYWGIRGYTSVCAKSFHGYQFNQKKSVQKFNAPLKDGIYYITMGATLDYSCKNNNDRPWCLPEYAFAVLKVGNPDPEKKITLTKVKKGSGLSLKSTLIKSGCFGDLNKIEWFLNGEKLAYDDQKEIPITKGGTYKVMWSNCLGSIADSINHNINNDKAISFTVTQNPKPANNKESGKAAFVLIQDTKPPKSEEKKEATFEFVKNTGSTKSNNTAKGTIGSIRTTQPDKETDIAELIKNNDKFVLEHLIFDLSKSDIKPEAKKELDKVAEIMNEKPSMRILLEGHTDNRGNAKKNRELSEKRVKAAKKYLVSQGVMRGNIETKGWGDQKPLIITNDIEEGKINRRVEIQILSR